MADAQESPERSWKTFFSELIPKWLVNLSLVVLILAVAWRVATAEVFLDLTGFEFTDFLALLLAVSAVGLSALFYFKATEASNRFYDNSYKFTKDISEKNPGYFAEDRHPHGSEMTPEVEE